MALPLYLPRVTSALAAAVTGSAVVAAAAEHHRLRPCNLPSPPIIISKRPPPSSRPLWQLGGFVSRISNPYDNLTPLEASPASSSL